MLTKLRNNFHFRHQVRRVLIEPVVDFRICHSFDPILFYAYQTITEVFDNGSMSTKIHGLNIKEIFTQMWRTVDMIWHLTTLMVWQTLLKYWKQQEYSIMCSPYITFQRVVDVWGHNKISIIQRKGGQIYDVMTKYQSFKKGRCSTS